MDKNKKMVIENFLEQKIIYPLDEKEFDRAYDHIDTYVKSIIKKSIHLNYLFLENEFFKSRFNKKREITLEGLKIIEVQQKKRGIVAFLSKDFNSPSQLIALILIPRILGIDTFVIGNYPKWPINLLVTLEFLGISHVYNLDEKKLSHINVDFDPNWSFFSLGTPLPTLKEPVKYLNLPKYGLVVKKNDSSSINIKHIQIAHPSLNISEIAYDDFKKSYPTSKLRDIDVIYTECGLNLPPFPSPFLILGRGLETFWFFPHLDINDFLVEQYSIFKIE